MEFELSDHWIILTAVIIVGSICYMFMGICVYFLYKMLRKMMSYHDNFAEVHCLLDRKIDRVISRQGKMAGIMWNVLNEHRSHDKKVQSVFEDLGIKTGDDDRAPGS